MIHYARIPSYLRNLIGPLLICGVVLLTACTPKTVHTARIQPEIALAARPDTKGQLSGSYIAVIDTRASATTVKVDFRSATCKFQIDARKPVRQSFTQSMNEWFETYPNIFTGRVSGQTVSNSPGTLFFQVRKIEVNGSCSHGTCYMDVALLATGGAKLHRGKSFKEPFAYKINKQVSSDSTPCENLRASIDDALKTSISMTMNRFADKLFD